MNKYGISEAKSRVGFKTYAVQNIASTERQSLRGWLIRGAVFVTAFSLVFSVFTPVTTAAPNQDKDVTVCHFDDGEWDNLQMKQSRVGSHNSHEADFVIDGKDKKCPGEGNGDKKLVVACHYHDGDYDRLLLELKDYNKDHKNNDKQDKNHPNDYLSQNGICEDQGDDGDDEEKKVDICHATASHSNPYIANNPNKSANVQGHDGHNGPVWFEGIQVAWGDIIPPFDYGDDDSYSGKNWTTEGQAIYRNGCEIPEEEPDPCDDIQTQGIVEPCPPKELTVKILKTWEGYDGLPTNHDDITITVDSSVDDQKDCRYKDGELDCKIDFYEGSTIDVEETGLPAGWEVDPTTVGNEIVPNCNYDKEARVAVDNDNGRYDCTHTIINRYQEPKPCGEELVINGGFELPEVTASQGWDVFPSGSAGMGWSVDWLTNEGDTPDIGNLELHKGVNGWDSNSGNQHTELDSDWGGPSSNQTGENASVKIYQDLITKVGSTYTVKFWTSPRPSLGSSENEIQFIVGGIIDMTVNQVAGDSDTAWTEHVHTFVATAGVTRLAFADAGSGNSLGGFLDDVSVKEDCLSDVTICKVDNSKPGNPLPGWTVMLKGDKLETVSVDSALVGGANSTNTLESDQSYLVVAKGTWQNRTFENVDARFTTPDGWTTQLEAPQGGFPDNLLELQVDGQFVDWSSYSSTHEYNVIVTGDGSTTNFGVFDGDADANTQYPDWFGDNIGSLTVDIYPIYSGVTGENGCVTLQDVPYGEYKLDEIMQDGWENVSGQGRSVDVDEPEEPGMYESKVIEQPVTNNEFTLVNECTSEQCEGPMLHLIKVVCAEYNDVQGNADADNADDTGEKYTEFWNYNNGTFNPSPLINGFVHPNEIPFEDEGKDCARADGWNFKLASNFDQTNDVQEYTTVNGEYMTPISGLPEALQQAIRGENEKTLWISEVEKEGYGFAALRCYNDALNGDNLEYINIGDKNPSHIYCIAYNVELEKPCVEERVAVAMVSETDTQTAGYTDENPVDGPLSPSLYNDGSFGNSALANTVIPPWIDPANYAPFTGSGAKWISTSSVHPGQEGGEGGVGDQWRLFQKKFTVPAGASVTPGTIYFTSDNAVSVYLNGTLIDDTSENLDTYGSHSQNPYQVFANVYSTTFTPVAGQENKLEFVVRNSGGDYNENPTGLLYKADFAYTTDCDGGNGGEYSLGGKVYRDNNTQNGEYDGVAEDGLADWTVELYKVTEGESLVGTDLSDANGDYSFSGLTAGCYIVREVLKSGWAQTDPTVLDDSGQGTVTDYEYNVSLGGAYCGGDVTLLDRVSGMFVKTANATEMYPLNVDDLNFGNIETNGSSTNGGGGSSGSRRTPDNDGRVLGDVTTNDPGQVLGAATELPRTGTPLSIIFTILALTGIILIPRYALAIEKK